MRTDRALIVAACIVAVGLLGTASVERYEFAPSGTGRMVRLDKFTGEVADCAPRTVNLAWARERARSETMPTPADTSTRSRKEILQELEKMVREDERQDEAEHRKGYAALSAEYEAAELNPTPRSAWTEYDCGKPAMGRRG